MKLFERRISPICVVLLALACQACGWNPFAAKEEYVRRGRQFAEQGRVADATIQYRKALQKDASYGEAYLRYGQLMLGANNHQEAFQALSRAVDLMPASDEAKTELGNLAISGLLGSPSRPPKYYEIAARISNELLARNPKSFDGLRMKGLLALVDRHPAEAIDALNHALQAKPNQPDVVTILVQTLVSENRGSEAETIARNGLASVKTYGPLYDTLYGYYISTHRPADAEQLMKSKIANNPKEPRYVIQLADHYWRQKQTGEADALLSDFTSRSQEFPKAPLDAGDFYRRVGKPEQAIALFQKGLESDRANRKEYLQRIVAVRMEQARFPEATAAVDTILKEFPDDLEALSSRAALRMASGTPADIQRALEEFNTLVKKAPDNIKFRFEQARALRQTGDEAQARSALVEILRRNPNHKNALREIADLEIRSRKPDEALQYAERLVALDPGNVGARLVRTSAWALRGRQTEARAELRRLIADYPNQIEPALQMATLELDQRNYPEAERLYQRIRTAGKFDIRPLRGLVAVYLARGQTSKALDLVRQEAKRTPDFQTRSLLASTAAEAGDIDLALSTAQAMAHDFPPDSNQLVFIGRLQEQKGQLDQAILSFDKARQIAPKDGLVVAQYGLALMRVGRATEGIAALRESVQLKPDSPALLNNLAWHLAEAGSNLEEAQALSLRAARMEPSSSIFNDTLGMVYLKAGKPDLALQIMQGLVHKEPGSPTYRVHLARTLLVTGQHQKARTELDAATRNHPSPAETQEIQQLLASLRQ